MAYIAPNSTIEIFGDVSLAPNQEDTLYFASTSAKDSYFSGLSKLATFTAQSYTRKERGFIRVEATMAQLYTACYMRFKNTSFENKWFYAFVLSVNYVNNVTVEVEFEIDVMMSWMGAFELGQCYVERQHTVGDGIGDNIADEGIPCGDYKYEFVTSSGYVGSNGFWYCLATTYDPTSPTQVLDGAEYGGIYSGVKYLYTSSVDTLDGWLVDLTTGGQSDGIVGISVVPYSFITEAGELPVERSQAFTKPYTDLDGYVPKNNKMYCYPYKSLQVTNLEGNFAEFRYEFFSGNSAQFTFIGSTGVRSQIVCEPINYKGVQENITEKISMDDFPMCAYAIDSFLAYLAQNKSSIAANVISTAGSIAAGLATGGATATVALANASASKMSVTQQYVNARGFSQGVGMANDIIGQLGTLMDYARKPAQAGGAQGTDVLIGRTSGRQKKDFYFMGRTITRNYAIMIDNFFTMFGYKVDQVLVPNMNARPYFTYVKTNGCVVHGNIPADDCRVIEAMFDRGTRFWKNHNQIGNYNVNNSPA